MLNADFGQRTKDIWKLRDISISPFIPLRKGGENLGFSWNSTSQARNQDFMWGGANEAKADPTTEVYFLSSDPFI